MTVPNISLPASAFSWTRLVGPHISTCRVFLLKVNFGGEEGLGGAYIERSALADLAGPLLDGYELIY